jgi:prepilin-type N-terminal cleavage/methylation domain-containing protein/prepilin-type processing-associated H-X9-DG protein
MGDWESAVDVQPRRWRAFTLPELLVVVGIIALLIGLLLPSLKGAWDSARLLQCAGNVRQICLGLAAYAADFDGRYPPNLDGPGIYWHSPDVMEKYLGRPRVTTPIARGVGGGVLVCPNDTVANPWRSYGVNVWSSARSDAIPPGDLWGEFWSANVRAASSMLLVAEAWPTHASTVAGVKWAYHGDFLGAGSKYPGERFGLGGGLAPPRRLRTFGNIYANSELPYYRHRKSSESGSILALKGQVNIGYADGHVEARRLQDLGDFESGRSSFQTLWSPIDRQIERP